MTTFGVDVSHWQNGINWSSAKATAKFAIAKATEGISYYDDTYKVNKSGCYANGVAFGAYHFFRSNVDPIQQANNFYSFAGSDVKVLVADVETNDGGNIKANLQAFLMRLEQLSGKAPWIYTAFYFWRDNIGAQSWASRLPLWVANYGVNQPLIPPGWSTWQIWQYSSSGRVPGISGNCDMDYFNGTEAQMQATFGGITPPPSQPLHVMVNVTSLTIRNAPIVQDSTILGYTSLGKIWTVEDTVKDTQGRNWYKVGANVYIAGWLCIPV